MAGSVAPCTKDPPKRGGAQLNPSFSFGRLGRGQLLLDATPGRYFAREVTFSISRVSESLEGPSSLPILCT